MHAASACRPPSLRTKYHQRRSLNNRRRPRQGMLPVPPATRKPSFCCFRLETSLRKASASALDAAASSSASSRRRCRSYRIANSACGPFSSAFIFTASAASLSSFSEGALGRLHLWNCCGCIATLRFGTRCLYTGSCPAPAVLCLGFARRLRDHHPAWRCRGLHAPPLGWIIPPLVLLPVRRLPFALLLPFSSAAQRKACVLLALLVDSMYTQCE